MARVIIDPLDGEALPDPGGGGGGLDEAEVDARVALGIAGVVDVAPGTLDTLNELAASLNDDDDFAGTMTTALAGKASVASVTAVADDVTTAEAAIVALEANIDLIEVIPWSFVLSGKGEAVDAVAADVGPAFRMPFDAELLDVRLTAGSATTTGTLTVDMNESGTSVLSTKLTIDATELTSETADTAAVISDSVLAEDAPITWDIDDEGDGTAEDVTATAFFRRTVAP